MSALIPTEPCTPAKPTAKRGLPSRPASPLSPTPAQPTSDPAEFAATFGPPTEPVPAGAVTLRLVGSGDTEVAVTASSGSPPHDGDSPAGAAMVESPCPTQAPLRLEAVNKALEMFQTATPTSQAAPGAGGVATATAGTSNMRIGPTAIASQLQPSLMAPTAGWRGDEAAHAPPARIVALRDATVPHAHNAVAVASSTSTLPSSSAVVVRTASGGATPAASSSVGVRTGSSGRLAEKMSVERVIAMGREFWLAYGDVFRASTAWYRDGRADILVHRAAADAAREAQAAHAADPDTVPAPEAPGRALGWTIGSVTTDRCYVRSDGNYKGPMPTMAFQKPFAQTTLSLALGPPPAEFPDMVRDYNASLASLKAVLPKGTTEKSGHIYQNLTGQHFRLRHALFAPKAEDEGADGADDAVLPEHFTMSGWPTYSPAAAQALADIAHSHIVRPLPAFDLKGDLIHPSRYMAELRGATVLAGFSTTVYHIGEKNASGRDVVRVTVCLDIEYLRVLIPPPQFSPKKRSAIHLTDPISRASQKRRAFW